MNEDIKKQAKFVLEEIANARRYSESTAPHDLFLSCEAIISSLAFLIGPLMDLETAYRQKVRTYMLADHSHAKAEALAKADQEYQDWRKLQYAYDLANQQIMLLKKFSDKLQQEFKRS